MLLNSDTKGAELAALLSGRSASRNTDLSVRLRDLPRDARADAKRLKRFGTGPARTIAEMAALAYPDRIGLRRAGDAPRYVMSGGKGAKFDDGDALAGQRLIVALDLDGDAREARIRLATPISESEVRGVFADQITWRPVCEWSKRDRRVIARQQERLGAVVLQDRIWKDACDEDVAAALMTGVRDLGLGCLDWSKSAKLLRARVNAVGLKDWSDEALLASLEDWLLPYAGKARSAADLKGIDLAGALRAALTWDEVQSLDRTAPAKFTTPLGRDVAVDYSGDTPAIEVRLQELFGVTQHPMIGTTPLKITLLSPGHKPVQVTMDLPGFWASSYADVRKDMRGSVSKAPLARGPDAGRSDDEAQATRNLGVSDNFEFQAIDVVKIEALPRLIIRVGMGLEPRRFDPRLGLLQVFHDNSNMVKRAFQTVRVPLDLGRISERKQRDIACVRANVNRVAGFHPRPFPADFPIKEIH